jgi:hypothetical protein
MKRNGNLTELVEELRNQNLRKKDFVVPASYIKMQNGELIVTNPKGESAELSSLLAGTGIMHTDDLYESIRLKVIDTCHQHLCDKLDIAKKYYDRLKEKALDLLDINVSYWLQKSNSNYFLRTFIDKEEKNGHIRAFLSDRFRVIDNYDVLLACLEAVKESGIPLQVQSADITDKKMYVRFVAPEIEIHAPALLKEYKVPNGDGGGKTGIMSGLVISNSEIGYGQFSISPRAVISACDNGMIFSDDNFAKTHIGAKMDEFSEIVWSEETKHKNYELIIAQVKDAIKTFVSPEYVGKKIKAIEEKIVGAKLQHPIDAVKNVCTSLKFSDKKEADILNYFIQGGDLSLFGVSQAMTYYAHKDADADEQYELETVAVKILDKVDEFDKPHQRMRSAKGASLN